MPRPYVDLTSVRGISPGAGPSSGADLKPDGASSSPRVCVSVLVCVCLCVCVCMCVHLCDLHIYRGGSHRPHRQPQGVLTPHLFIRDGNSSVLRVGWCWDPATLGAGLCFPVGSAWPLHQHLRGPSLVPKIMAASLLFCQVTSHVWFGGAYLNGFPVLWDLLGEPLFFCWFVLT